VTQRAISEIVGLSPAALSAYPQIKTIFEQIAASRYRSEDELTDQVQKAIQRLESLGQPVTQRAISEIVGLSPAALRAYPQIKTIFEQIAASRYRSEDELADQVQKAIQRLESLGQSVTQRAICEIVGMSRTVLRKHPQIKAIIEQSITNYRRCREDELVSQVQEAIRRLESLGQPVTQKAIGEIVGMSPGGLKYHARTKIIMEEIARKNRRGRRNK
jgi:DNA-binding transcriptional MerR regulator